MQQEILSYAFQLKQNSKCTSVSSHPHQMSFFCSALKKDDSKQSILYKLNYNEDNPKKSIVNNVEYKGIVNGIHSINMDGSTCKIFINVNQGENYLKILPIQALDKTGYVQKQNLQVFFKGNNKIIDLQKGKQSTLFVTTTNELLSVDPNKPTQPEAIVKLEADQQISHSSVDPARGFLAYCINNQVYLYQKSLKASKFSQKYKFKICPKSGDNITNIQFNPSKQFYLMTSHHDYMKFWDIRKSNIPVKTVSDNHTLLLKSIYNNVHDQLILGCYDDGTIGLYRMQSVSSSPSGEGSDTLVKLYDQHEDAVYHACWGTSPWVFASVAYPATNFVVNIVPSVEKYRILL